MDHSEYLDEYVVPGVKTALERGSKMYTGQRAWDAPHVITRTMAEDVRHMRDCHISVRLGDAEDAADNGNVSLALAKIESAIGYLVILHRRLSDKDMHTVT